jgi:peptide/nickel transport system substrate-binding protein
VVATAAVATAPTPAPAASDGTADAVFTVGTKQDVDSMNPVAGLLLSSYEVWNLQYDVLVNLKADDLSPVPDIATSWSASPDGKTWTYQLRTDMKWSDGQPLTSKDVVYTLTRARDEQWANFYPFVSGFTDIAAPDDHTVVITSADPNPQLPGIPVYVLPEHVWKKYNKKQVSSYPNTNPVTSGPFRLTQWNKGSFWEMTANPGYFAGAPKIGKVRFRVFGNDEAMAGALRNGEVDAVHDLNPQLKGTISGSNITTVDALDGTFTQLTMNTGSGPVGNGHPALEDPRVRQAIAHAIDKNELVSKVLKGLGEPGQSVNVSIDPKYNLTVPADKTYDFNIATANSILDQAGYAKGSNGIRTMPGGGDQLKFRFYYPTSNSVYSRDVEFISKWLRQIGIATEVTAKSEDELTPIENQGKFDLVVWSWTPYVDPSPQVSYLTCGQVPATGDDGRYNDAFWCNNQYDALYTSQRVELDPAARVQQIKDAQQLVYDDAPYVVLYKPVTLQAYRNDRFTGFVQQPASTGPVIYSQSDPSYPLIEPVATTSGGSGQSASGSSDSGGGGSSTGVILAVVAAVIVIGGGGLLLARRRRTADERE